MQLLDGERNRRDFLHELGADQVGQRAAARAGDEDAAVVRSNADFVLHALEEFQQLLRLLGLVALVVLPDHLVGLRYRPPRPSPWSSRRPCRRYRPLCGRTARRLRATWPESAREGTPPLARNSAGHRAGRQPLDEGCHKVRVGENDSLALHLVELAFRPASNRAALITSRFSRLCTSRGLKPALFMI